METPSQTILQPQKKWIPLDLGEIWQHRELLFFLAWRDVKVLYKQTALGVGWAVVQPIVMMIVFSLVFGRLAKLPSDEIPYPIFTFAALLPWQLFAGTVQRSSTSIVSNTNLVTKVYFPRLIIPLSALVVGVIDFSIAGGVFIGLMIWYEITPTWHIITLPFFITLTLISALSISLWFSALNVKYRDVAYIIPFLVQVGLFITPIAYSESLVPEGIWKLIYGLNPMAGVVQGFRWAILGSTPPDTLLFASISMTSILLLSGLYYFRHTEQFFADVV